MAANSHWFLSAAVVSVATSVALPNASWGQATASGEQARLAFFEKKIRPLLVDNCYNCHSANTNSRGGLRVDDRNGLLLGGGRGAAVVPGDPENSLLIRAVRQTGEIKMPPRSQLSEEQIADLEQWIRDGAAWPKPRLEIEIGKPNAEYDRLRAEHWAWQPLTAPAVPMVQDAAWPRDAIDRFVLAKLEEQGLTPVGDADPLMFIRRVTFDLTGLPPTPQEIAEFELQIADLQSLSTPAAPSSRAAASIPRAAIEELVDRLLASPAFGERWGRHWLDVARYGESTGSARNVPYPHAWRYRDYVVDSFNSDKPYNQFLREQIAGDLLPADSQAQRDERLIATGFLALGVRDVNQRFKVRFVMDNIDEQIDTVSRAILGLTVSCARCHDHKFDPVPTTDYYALAGIFLSSDLCAALRNKMGGGGMDYYDTDLLLRLGSAHTSDEKMSEQIAQAKQSLAQARSQLLALQENTEQDAPEDEREKKIAQARAQVKKMQEQLLARSDPAVHGPVALGVRDAKSIADTEIRIRGEAEKLGPVVPRGFLTVFDVPDASAVNPRQSGRLELAEWLASPHNPLTPRVMANRIWQHLFGQGIVASVDNFGITGDLPTHPELLDHLATRFIDDGWSVKKLVRAIVLSRAYQLSSIADCELRIADSEERPQSAITNPQSEIRNPQSVDPQSVDPANRLFWRHSPRRLEAEEIRDAMLLAAGNLDPDRPAGSPAKDLKVMEMRNTGTEAQQMVQAAEQSLRRSLYLPLVRGVTPRSLEVFDFAEQGMVTGSRDNTTVATQALYLLNDPFVRRQAQGLTDRLMQQKELDESGRLELAYRLTLNRPATPREIERAKEYLAECEAAYRSEKNKPADPAIAAWTSFCQALFASAEFRYVR